MKKLRILMYHSVSDNGLRDGLTVDTQQLEQHFHYLWSNNYKSVLLSDLLACHEQKKPLPEKAVLITFDDGFRNNYELAYPLAKKYQLKLNFFLVPAFIKQGAYREKPCLSAAELQKMDPAVVEFGLHSFDHQGYDHMQPAEIEYDLDNCIEAFHEMGVPVQPCLAYPYGAWPRKVLQQSRFFEILEESGIRLAFRIGNRINRFPIHNRFLLERIDVRGDESFHTFKLSLSFGKKRTGWLAPLFRALPE
ncbi:MAG: polysaccharide deacetylase family protein [Bacteroidetes bacterium]|nr:polysaccharide deacetylase family protein [Bacteroidota bacterium]